MKEDEAPSVLVSVLYSAVGIATLTLWEIVGLVFWLPLLIRTTILFLVAVLHDTLTGTGDAMRSAQLGLDVAIGFYVRGFMRISGAIRRQHATERSGEYHAPAWGRMVMECLWASIVLFATLWAMAGFPVSWFYGSR
jgi:hypothetical protein